VATDRRQPPCFPGMDRVLLGSYRRLVTGADLFHRAPVPGQDVLAIWQPGDSEYAAWGTLPT
jgi:hypothetical protein